MFEQLHPLIIFKILFRFCCDSDHRVKTLEDIKVLPFFQENGAEGGAR